MMVSTGMFYLKFFFNSGLILQYILVQDVLQTAMIKEYALMESAGLDALTVDTTFGLIDQHVTTYYIATF